MFNFTFYWHLIIKCINSWRIKELRTCLVKCNATFSNISHNKKSSDCQKASHSVSVSWTDLFTVNLSIYWENCQWFVGRRQSGNITHWKEHIYLLQKKKRIKRKGLLQNSLYRNYFSFPLLPSVTSQTSNWSEMV